MPAKEKSISLGGVQRLYANDGRGVADQGLGRQLQLCLEDEWEVGFFVEVARLLLPSVTTWPALAARTCSTSGILGMLEKLFTAEGPPPPETALSAWALGFATTAGGFGVPTFRPSDRSPPFAARQARQR